MVNVKIDYVPQGNQNRPGTKANMQWITIHNTANPRSTAQNERDYVTRRTDNVSFHYAIDEKEVIAIIPEDEVAWHAGTREGNLTSIGIELCESGDQQKVWNNAVEFVARLLDERGWGVDRVRTHQSWSGKNCPRLILPRWQEFISDIVAKLKERRSDKMKEVPKWKFEGIEYLYGHDILDDVEGWSKKIDEPMPVWAVTLLLKKLHENLKGEK